MVIDFDDFGANHIISGMCQAHDCRSELDQLHLINPAFKVTLFAIPGEMTPELLEWCEANKSWVELGCHGFFHSSNYECEKISYEEFAWQMERFKPMLELNFAKVFRAPGWQISSDAMRWLKDNGWIIADQGYNDDRRPAYMDAYINYDNQFQVSPKIGNPRTVEAHHGHTWDCVGNGIYQTFDYLKELVKSTDEFKTISELFV